MFKTPPRLVILIYKRQQDSYEKLKKYNLIDVFIDIANFDSEVLLNILQEYSEKDYLNRRGVFIILDDLMSSLTKDFENLFTIEGHHNFATILMTSQKLHFNDNKYRVMTDNLDYNFLMKSPRKSDISTFARQTSPHDTYLPLFAYKKATANKPYSYLLYDGTQDIEEKFRFR